MNTWRTIKTPKGWKGIVAVDGIKQTFEAPTRESVLEFICDMLSKIIAKEKEAK